MNILIIGNGFDLAHDLPTTYKNFLEAMQIIQQYYKSDFSYFAEDYEDTRVVKEMLSLRNKNREVYDELEELINKNPWIDYFLKYSPTLREGWIDFEAEISKVIQSLDYMRKYWEALRLNPELDFNDKNCEIARVILGGIEKSIKTDYLSDNQYIKEIINPLVRALNKLIRSLEIYLTEFVGKLEIKCASPDIKELVYSTDKVLSFNYTSTYERVYANIEQSIEYDFIHGRARVMNSLDSNDMVLGIDEYLDEDKKNKEVDFIEFKKYFQRIHKETGCKYKEWVNKIEGKEEITTFHDNRIVPWIETEIVSHNIYIFGHSLDITDKDILRELILHDNIVTTIFYLNKKVYAQQIANLVKVIGQDELVKRVSEPNKTIIFKQQKDMIPVV